MSNNGFIKLFRSMMDWEWYHDGNTLRVFLNLLLDVNHKQRRWQGVDVMPGQTITSFDKISKQTGISVQSVRTSINKLKSTGEITSKSTNRFTLVTVVNWALYQGDCSELTSESTDDLTNNQQTTNKQLTTNKNDKNVNNVNNTRKTFKKPTAEEISQYCKQRNNGIEANRFIDHYESNGWMIGKNKMKDWKAAIRTWEARQPKKKGFDLPEL